VHVWRGDQLAGEVVGPGVIGTLDASRESSLGLGGEAGAAMAADVIEGAQPTAGVTRQNAALAGDFAQHVIAWRRYVFLPRHADPHLRVEPILFAREDLRVRVVGRGQRRTPFHGHAVRLPSKSVKVRSTSAAVCAIDR